MVRRRRAKREASLLVEEPMAVSVDERPRRRAKSPKQIGVITVLSVPYSVAIAHPDDTEGKLNDDDHACHDEEGARILLHEGRNFNGARTWSNVAHETLHAWLEDSGADHVIQKKTGDDPNAHTDFIESLVRMLSPALMSSIDDLVVMKKKLLRKAGPR